MIKSSFFILFYFTSSELIKTDDKNIKFEEKIYNLKNNMKNLMKNLIKNSENNIKE